MRVSFTGGPIAIAERARKAFQLASQEAHRLNHEAIGLEHLLLGLAKETLSPAARALRDAGFGLQWLRQQVERRHPAGAACVKARAALPYSAELDAFVDAILGPGQACGALRLTPELLLLALVESAEGVAGEILESRRWATWRLRRRLRRLAQATMPAPQTPDLRSDQGDERSDRRL